jgi:TonB-linked SusC/RagA family outer membrane protein
MLYKMKKYLFLIFLVISAIIFNSNINAQILTVTGTVKSSSDNETLPGASVVELDKNNRIINGVITDMNGKYVIKITNPENKISFSFVGYKTKVESINGRKVIDISLDAEQIQLESIDIVAQRSVNSGFLSVEERNLTTSVQRIATKDIADVQASSIDEALQGRLAGVDIVASSGDPGAGMSIRIRGTTSINSSSKPLIVVDGIPYETEIAQDFDFATADEEGYAQMLNIPIANIQEIAVLKDAAATAQYGSRAANGVLIINTKRGSAGLPRIEYSLNMMVSEQPDVIPMLNGDQYASYILEGFMNLKGIPLKDSAFLYDPNYSKYYEYSQNTDWIKAVTRTGFMQEHNLSLSGGGDKAKYRVAVGYSNQLGTTIGTSLTKISTMMNLDYTVSDKISFTTDLSYNRGDNDKNYPEIDKSKYKSIREMAYIKMPNMSIYEMDSIGNPTDVFFSPRTTLQGDWSSSSKYIYNPVAMALRGKYNIVNNRIIPKFGLRYTILKNLKYTFDVAFDINNEKRKAFLPQEATGLNWYEDEVNKTLDRDNDVFIVQTFNKLFYSPKINENNQLTFLASVITYDNTTYSYQSVTSNTASSELQDPVVPSRIIKSGLGPSSGKSKSRTLAELLIVNYSYKDKYIFSGSIRRDGSSKFGKTYRYGYFPSISARWRISDESFMKSFKFINDLSLRASYGQNGNEPGSKSYTQYNQYGTFDWTYLGEPAMYSKTMELANKRWETTIQKNLGFNLVMFNQKINIDFDVYHKRTKDLFFENLAIPSQSGFSTMDMNVGVMDNQGWELSIMNKIIDNKASKFSLDFNFNIARNQNIIREISELYPKQKGKTTNNGEYLSIIQINNPIGSFYGYRCLGVYPDKESTIARDADGNKIYDINGNPVYMTFNYPSNAYIFQPGDAIYEDINHDGNINEYDIVYLGDANPLFTGGFGINIRYKGLSIGPYFHFRYGNDIVNYVRMQTEKMYDYDNQSTAVLRRWRQEGDTTDIPRAMIGGGYNWLGSSRFVEDGSFIRLKNLSISYTLPNSLTKKLKINTLKIGITATNLFTWTKYSGQDPEISYSDDPFMIGYDKSRTPRSRDITFKLSFSF